VKPVKLTFLTGRVSVAVNTSGTLAFVDSEHPYVFYNLAGTIEFGRGRLSANVDGGSKSKRAKASSKTFIYCRGENPRW
jgi:hypothetical protein